MKPFKKILKWFNVVYYLVVILSIFALGILMVGTLLDKEAVQSPYIMGILAICLGLLSIPGTIIDFSDIILYSNKNKKEHKYSGNCPHCKQLVEFTMTEK